MAWLSRLSPRRPSRRLVLLVAAAILCLPVLLTILYAVVPPVSMLMLGRYVTGLWVERDWEPLENISPHLIRSVVASEDGRFCEHAGVDWDALSTQIEALGDGDAPRGASTLTMQLAKNLFLWNGRSYVRKGLEIPLALVIDATLPKRRIIELYLNVAEWGEGIFGAEAAAQAWFGKSAKELTASQASLLATALPSPLTRNPARPSAGHRRLARINFSRARALDGHVDCIFGDKN
ncbi:monofunctional biosynthetic peptidoglycan transglycosylase [Stappia sp. F7233]|uniref:Biosynthetic peptidoglycan transglycosylase n=1 Tax=Stappia albiluteola TaxID=2758565 RepID=A0A839AJJ1_9HYPH|nr:monofunctional biosynthetic peptidoglycan transglycosylase [Stappia albiluteola]MBA5778659.1 monofunctional biosynthetic peptidoglycan transglycosylase [Stappia albiluteola]